MEDLIFKLSNSLVVQSYDPKFMFHHKNFSGSGFIAWDQARNKKQLFLYKSKNLPFMTEIYLILPNTLKQIAPLPTSEAVL